MSELHRAYLSLGSNLQPETNLVKAVELLQNFGRLKTSNAWESASVGAAGPNYLNACALLVTSLSRRVLKEQAIDSIETALGRQRGEDKFAPRTMDIDIVIFDDRSCDDKYWEQAFVVVPLAEIHPAFQNPLRRESIAQTAMRLRQQVWMEVHPELLKQISEGGSSR